GHWIPPRRGRVRGRGRLVPRRAIELDPQGLVPRGPPATLRLPRRPRTGDAAEHDRRGGDAREWRRRPRAHGAGMKKIKVTLRRDGSQDVEVLGASGDECVRFTRDLE